MFALLLVTAVVLVGIISHAAVVTHRAIDQLHTAHDLMRHLVHETKAAPFRTLANALTGSDNSPTHLNTGLHLQVEPVDNKEQVRTENQTPFGQHSSSFDCWVFLDLNQYFIVSDSVTPQFVIVRGPGSDQPNLMVTSLDGVMRPWDVVSNTSFNLSNFIRLWDTLASANLASRIASIDSDAGAMIVGTPMYYSSAAFRQDYEVTKSSRVEVDPKISPPTFTGIVQREDYIKSRTRDSSMRSISWQVQYSDDILAKWQGKGLHTLVAAHCIGKVNGEAVKNLVTMPAALHYDRFDWPGAWIQRAIETGFLSQDRAPSSQSFGIAFPDLYRESKGIESLSFDEIQGQLTNRLRVGNEDQSVSLLGVSFPIDILRTVGVAIILLLQLYATLHLAETVRRMSGSTLGDPGAFKPWVMLYGGSIALVVSVGIVVAPSLATIVITLHHIRGEIPKTFGGAIGVIGMILSCVVAVFGLCKVHKLRREARRHRQAPRKQELTAENGTDP